MPSLSRISRTILAPAALCLAVALAAIPAMVQAAPPAQSVPPVIAKLAQETARAVAKRKPRSVLIAPGRICLLNAQLCGERNSALRAALRQLLPGVRFVNWETAVRLLPKYGFLPVDGYLGSLLHVVAAKAGADLLVTQSAEQHDDRFRLADTVIDTLNGRQLAKLAAEAPASVLPVPDHPVLYRDPHSGAYILISTGRKGNDPSGPFVYAKCKSCPEPRAPQSELSRIAPAKVVVLATIATKGGAEQISLVKAPDVYLARLTLQSIQSWTFAPASLNGKEIPVRIPISVTYRIAGR